MVEGPVDLARVMGLEDAPPRFRCDFQTSLSTWPVVLSSLGYHVRILLECSLWHWFELPIGLPYFLTFENEFGIKYFTWCLVGCMHAWYEKYEMTYYAKKYPTNHRLNACTINIEEKRKKKTLFILNPIFFCKFSCQVTLSRSSFIQTNIFRKKTYFFYHFQNDIFF